MKKATYTKEFKQEAVRLAKQAGNTFQQVAEDLGLHVKTLYKWSSEFQQHGESAFPGSGYRLQTTEHAEVDALKKELKRVLAERDILKKALQFFAKE